MSRLILCSLSSFVVGLALGLWAGSSPTLTWKPSADGASEAFYQGRRFSTTLASAQMAIAVADRAAVCENRCGTFPCFHRARS